MEKNREKKDYKDTLNLPRTDFPMKANLPAREPETLSFWEEAGIYGKMVEKNRDRGAYILHDGPPYANGHIHIGHALNKTLKDIIVKFKSMQGSSAPYVPGWDCHGLPIELEVDKKLGKKKAEIDIREKRLICREYASKFVDIQRDEFRRLGVLGHWEEPYLTMTSGYEAAIVSELMEFVKKGYAYRGKKPVHWCPSCVTALAEAEVEYADKVSPSIFVKFPLRPEGLKTLGLEGKDVSFLIWTTTPWTLPANLALAVHPDITYSAMETEDGVLLVAEELVSRLFAGDVLKPRSTKPLRTYAGAELVGLRAAHPFIERDSVVIAGDFVTVEEGSGIVHIAPGHGEDDYLAGLREGLDIYAPVNRFGKFEGTGVGEIEGQPVFRANETIIDILGNRGRLLSTADHSHSYPHCWRCKKPVIFRATEQWFISMEHEDLRKRCLQEVERVTWVPSWGKDRIQGMIENRPDWCISRQRSWGVPITVITCAPCGRIVRDQEVIDRIIGLVREFTSDVWFEKEAEEFLPPGYACPGCGGKEFQKEMDILDVWFESGVSHAATLTGERGLTWPADMYLEGSDQHRGWFQSSLLAAVGTRGRAPYKTVLTHGFVVDGKGKKMSKSLGNVVAPQDIIKSTGAEILRLWAAAEDYRGDIRISKEIVARLTEAYRKIRNTAKYLLGNLHDFPGGDFSSGLLELDRWAMSRLQGLVERVTAAYENFSFHEVYHRLYHFCVVDMSSFYLDILKDRLYTFRRDSSERRAAQWVLNEILMTMTRLMAPVLSFTAEEVWQFVREKPAESIFLASFPEAKREFMDPGLEEKWERLIAIRDEINKALELKRKERFIGNSLEAKVTIHSGPEDRSLLEGYADFLPTLLIVSQARMGPEGEEAFRSEEVEGLSITVERAEGEKCPRCWTWSTAVGSFEDEPELCERCHGNIR
jgi:isoleucyl-tRNA synthetase